MLYVGIDPGEHTGVAVWDSCGQKFTSIQTLKLHEAMSYVNLLECGYENMVFVVFEDARQRTWFPKERNASEYRGRLMGAGAAKRDAAIWEEFLTDYGIPFEAHKPQAHGTKWKADFFAKVTGYTGRTSEHARDAALLVFQRR